MDLTVFLNHQRTVGRVKERALNVEEDGRSGNGSFVSWKGRNIFVLSLQYEQVNVRFVSDLTFISISDTKRNIGEK